ncbi:MAG: PQQ-dependent sugar dehydrogenase [Planctomycetales bacterium]|nr:PQQ-dependent sugar dehydrogenase [Planctomycetales bacterium]
MSFRRSGALAAALAYFRLLAPLALAEVDESPLPVAVVPAFAELQWPDDLTGADEGRALDVRPLVVTGAGDGSGRLFVATQQGTIHVFGPNSDGSDRRLFLDLRDRVAFDPRLNEEGFLGLAFHPRFAENGEVFVNYTAKYDQESDRRSVVSRFKTAPGDPQRIDPASEEILIELRQPYWNHNGGTVVFGPDGYLYICFGDGGDANDPHMNAQNLHSFFGKILRIDVDGRAGDRPYAVPADNPFVGQGDLARDEIWAYGLRNVWRLSFDRETGVAWAGDVGQNLWEEIDLIVRGGNYGWNYREGRHPFGPGGFPANEQMIEPIWEYGHDVGKSITGGNVYRGQAIPQLAGHYLYGEYVTGQVWGLKYDFDKQEVVANRSVLAGGGPITSFGEDDRGEIYFTTQPGGVFKLEASESAAAATQAGANGGDSQRK